MSKIFKTILHILVITVTAAMITAVTSCSDDFDLGKGYSTGGNPDKGNRQPSEYRGNLVLLYEAGFNSLSSYLQENISNLKTGRIPTRAAYDDVVLVFSKYCHRTDDYKTQTAPVLTRIYRQDNKIVEDTLLVMDKGTIVATTPILTHVLNFVKESFPGYRYGMVFSSHSTGWLPAGYYSSPNKFNSPSGSMKKSSPAGYSYPSAVPYVEEPKYEGLPTVRTLGQEVYVTDQSTSTSFEIEIEKFANAIPMYLDYIIFDSCFGACVETAYALKDKCGHIIGSSSEVLSEGMNYTTLTEHLFGGEEPDLKEICQDYFDHYNSLSGEYRSATISLIDCSAIDNLANVCKGLFNKYGAQIAAVDPETIQGFFRFNKHWFYDLRDVLLKSGVTASDMALFDSAIADVVTYKANTPTFILANEHVTNFYYGFKIDTHCGLTTYLPCDGSAYLDNYYKNLSWNEATGLVK